MRPEKGLNERVIEHISWGRANRMDDQVPTEVASHVREEADGTSGSRSTCPTSTSRTSTTTSSRLPMQVDEWDDAARADEGDLREARHPRSRTQVPRRRHRQYECLRGSTLVWTTAGMRRSRTRSSRATRCSRSTSRRSRSSSAEWSAGAASGDKEIFEISAGARTIGASGNHPFLVLRDERREGRQRARYRTALGAGRRTRGRRPGRRRPPTSRVRSVAPLAHGTSTPVGFTTPICCWFFGLFLGDGYIKHSGGYDSVEVAVDRPTSDLIDEIVRVTHEQFGLDFSSPSDGFRLTAPGTRAFAELPRHERPRRSALTKRVPDWVFGLPSGAAPRVPRRLHRCRRKCARPPRRPRTR